MKIFKYLDMADIDNVSEKIYIFLMNNCIIKPGWTQIDHDKLFQSVPELKTFLVSLNLEVEKIILIVSYATGVIHIDYHQDARINFPVRNTKNTATTMFFRLDDLVKVREINGTGYPYWKLSYSKENPISGYILTSPVVFDPQVPHRVVFKKPLHDPRLILTIFVKDTAWYLLEK
jgi:hypothetical protein